MKKFLKIIIWVLVVIIFLLLILGGIAWYIIKKTNYIVDGNLQTKNISFELAELKNLEINTENLDIYLRESGNDKINLSLRTYDIKDFNIEKSNNTLNISGINKVWNSNLVKWINNNLKDIRKGEQFTVINPKLIIEIPINDNNLAVNFKSNTGDITINHIAIGKMNGNLGSGNINLSNLITNSLDITNMQGEVICYEVYAKNIQCNIDQGNLNAKEMYAENINININKGNLVFTNENKNYKIRSLNISVKYGEKKVDIL
ncbi:MAG: DUF4097 family beta strand repeat-containing protein [Sarcina sp.]